MVKLKRALGRSKEELSLSSRSNLFSSSTSIHSSASTAREARRREREADTPEINFAESDNRHDLDPAGINRERLGNVVVEKFASTPPHHPFSVSPLPAYLVANETLDGRSLTNSYMRHVALL